MYAWWCFGLYAARRQFCACHSIQQESHHGGGADIEGQHISLLLGIYILLNLNARLQDVQPSFPWKGDSHIPVNYGLV